MTLPLLKVDPAILARSGGALVEAAGDIPAPLAPLSVDGADPLSGAIRAGAAAVEEPLGDLPAIRASATSTGNNIVKAGTNYAETDEELGQRFGNHQFGDGPGGGAGSGGSSPAIGGGAVSGGGGTTPASPAPMGASPASPVGGASAGGQNMAQQFGQMPMQMAQQAGQIPQQLGGMMGSAPQGAMQGMQSATQQVSQLAGQFGKQDANGGDRGPTDQPVEARSDDDDGRTPEQTDQSAARDEPAGATSANQHGERAPVDPAEPGVESLRPH